MDSPRIDVLIPVFNAGRTIGNAVRSIQEQTVSDIRIVIVDDGSTDDSPAILARMAGADRRIEIFTRTNGGIVDALNFGLDQCRAEFVARHDGDDLALPDRFARQVGHLQANPACVAVGGSVRHIDEAGRPLGPVVRFDPPQRSDPLSAPCKEPYIPHPFLMTYRSRLQQVGGYRHVAHAEDSDLYWRLQETGTLHNLDDVLGDYRMHDHSISSRSIQNGRVMALGSQLAGISAARRRSQRPDLEFTKSMVAEYKTATSLPALFLLGARGLDADERDRLEISLSAKMLELTSYRPYELDMTDCRFIRRALDRHLATLTPSNRANVLRMCTGAAARLVGRGQFGPALALARPGLYPQVFGRLAFRAARQLARSGRLRARRQTAPAQ